MLSNKKKPKPDEQNWRPDWRDASQYTHFKSYTNVQWAWEFLRRSAEYHAFWQSDVVPHLRVDGSPNEFSKFEIIVQKALQKFGVERLPNPENNGHHKLFPITFSIEKTKYRPQESNTALGRDMAKIITPQTDNEIAIYFDIRFPLAPQLERAKQLLVKYQKPKNKTKSLLQKRGNKLLYPTYIRLLDADFKGISLNEMACIIHPNKSNKGTEYNAHKTVLQQLKAAKKLSELDYIFLSISANTQADK